MLPPHCTQATPPTRKGTRRRERARMRARERERKREKARRREGELAINDAAACRVGMGRTCSSSVCRSWTRCRPPGPIPPSAHTCCRSTRRPQPGRSLLGLLLVVPNNFISVKTTFPFYECCMEKCTLVTEIKETRWQDRSQYCVPMQSPPYGLVTTRLV